MAMSERLVASAEKEAAERGESISCRKGCGACCRELIPVSPAEAFFLRDYLHSRPAGIRRKVEFRFRKNRKRLEEAHVDGYFPFQDPGAYFKLGMPCPFLKDEACSIHVNRPLVCREHLVLSQAAYCGSFPNHSIRVLFLEGSVSEALSHLCAELLGRPPERISMLDALEWAESHAESGTREWNAGLIAEALEFHLQQVS